ncbi:LytR C-terminal domain-containing protein [Nocardia iowensis]|uniref:LytR C-terminal domain-containing protein n=1 Tax=Nocardia iowensis TaxID=204891 RepID=A0ABX8RNK3_NOCIO|nr:LytR C-terminal domain-containing protein [Nocardia iowensis]QXN91222.1 LytR C-terminal domain-containing protein [Nocardia iowensis]
MSYPNPTSGGPPLRALAMVLIALAIVFGGLGAMSLSKSDADSSGNGPSASTTPAPQAPASTPVAKPTTPAQVPATTPAPSSSTTTPPTTTPPPSTTAAAAAKSVPVRVLNNSLIVGLAAKTANQLTADGWNVIETGNYPGANIPKTTAYYGNSPGDREAATAIAQELGIAAESKSSGLGESSPGVTVIVTGN